MSAGHFELSHESAAKINAPSWVLFLLRDLELGHELLSIIFRFTQIQLSTLDPASPSFQVFTTCCGFRVQTKDSTLSFCPAASSLGLLAGRLEQEPWSALPCKAFLLILIVSIRRDLSTSKSDKSDSFYINI